jgi:hypothetical protein
MKKELNYINADCIWYLDNIDYVTLAFKVTIENTDYVLVIDDKQGYITHQMLDEGQKLNVLLERAIDFQEIVNFKYDVFKASDMEEASAENEIEYTEFKKMLRNLK